MFTDMSIRRPGKRIIIFNFENMILRQDNRLPVLSGIFLRHSMIPSLTKMCIRDRSGEDESGAENKFEDPATPSEAKMVSWEVRFVEEADPNRKIMRTQAGKSEDGMEMCIRDSPYPGGNPRVSSRPGWIPDIFYGCRPAFYSGGQGGENVTG